MEPNYMIVVVMKSVEAKCFGPFVDYKTAFDTLNNNPDKFGIYDPDAKVFLAPVEGYIKETV